MTYFGNDYRIPLPGLRIDPHIIFQPVVFLSILGPMRIPFRYFQSMYFLNIFFS
jgi:hypothetical protein